MQEWQQGATMSTRTYIKARPFDYPYDGNFEPTRTALLAIDLQIDFLSPEGYFAKKGYDPSPLRSILPSVNAVIKAARRAGCLIVHTRQGHRDDLMGMTPYGRWRRQRSGLLGTNVLLRGAPGYQIDPAVDVAGADVIVDKIANGAFTGTELETILRARGVTHLLFTGCTTDVCVHSTLREAVDRNFQCLLVEDCCASADRYAHEAAIHMVTVEDGIFGVVARAGDVIYTFNGWMESKSK
jgi:nicotinamidase-related amidase